VWLCNKPDQEKDLSDLPIQFGLFYSKCTTTASEAPEIQAEESKEI